MLKDFSNSQWISPKCTETEAHHLLQAPGAIPFPVRPQIQHPHPIFLAILMVAVSFPLRVTEDEQEVRLKLFG